MTLSASRYSMVPWQLGQTRIFSSSGSTMATPLRRCGCSGYSGCSGYGSRQALGRHVEGEHLLRGDADVEGRLLHEVRPRVPVPGRVDSNKGLAEAGMGRVGDVDELPPPVHGDAQLLTGQVGGAHGWLPPQVTVLDRVVSRAEVERPPGEDPVLGGGQGAAVHGRGGDDK